MNEITIEEATRLKTKLEHDILDLIVSFENMTGTKIENVELNRVYYLGNQSQCIGVKTGVCLVEEG